MDKTRITPGMWRINPLKLSHVVDRFGKKIGSAETGSDASMMAAAPDLYDVLEKLENHEGEIPEEMREEIQMALRRARGDLGIAVFSAAMQRQRRMKNEEWLKFMDGLVNPPSEPEK
jgi:hypothetical protein